MSILVSLYIVLSNTFNTYTNDSNYFSVYKYDHEYLCNWYCINVYRIKCN